MEHVRYHTHTYFVPGINNRRFSLLPGTGSEYVSSIPVVRTFFVKKKKKEEASPQGKNRAMWGEEAKPLQHKNDAERKSDL